MQRKIINKNIPFFKYIFQPRKRHIKLKYLFHFIKNLQKNFSILTVKFFVSVLTKSIFSKKFGAKNIVT